MPSVCIIGAGQLGSRHLQALQNITSPLTIRVVDPSEQSLATAKERFAAIARTGQAHQVTFSERVDPALGPIDIAIVATSANVRRAVIEGLLAATTVRYLILEKLLFSRPGDYASVPQLIQKHGAQAWVNCSMRTMPFYTDLKPLFSDHPIQYCVTGSQYGLITNAIHYIDYLSFLCGSREFTLQTELLESKPFPSKRPGFLELNGTLQAVFSDGSLGSFTCYGTGTAPIMMDIFNSQTRCISRENEQRAWFSTADQQWQWREVEAPVPFQSTMTTRVVEELLSSGTCPLVPLEQSVPMHVTILEGVRTFLNAHSGQPFDYYPFT